ncbi:MAG: FeoC-like transcriptional regulator [Ectothiorhodospira sp.]
MILSQILDYLRTHRRVSLLDLQHRFHAEPEALRGMLATLERKGRVRRLPPGTVCGGGCSHCGQTAPELYEITEGPAIPEGAQPLMDLRRAHG